QRGSGRPSCSTFDTREISRKHRETRSISPKSRLGSASSIPTSIARRAGELGGTRPNVRRAREDMTQDWHGEIKGQKVDPTRFRIPRVGPMLTDGIVFADDRLMEHIRDDRSIEQVANVACLPGIVGPSIGMPDIHWGYGFPIGGVAAFDVDEGVISPGGVGYDINCGVRLLSTRLGIDDIRERLERLVAGLYANIPSGVGKARRDLSLDKERVARLVKRGARWAVEDGFGDASDLASLESGGCLPNANLDAVSERAIARGRDQVGTI